MPTPSQTAAVSQCVSHVSYHYPSSEVHQTELPFPARPNTLHFKSKITPEGEDGNQKLEPLRSVPDSLLSVTPAACWNVFLRKHGVMFLECPDDHTQTFCDGSIFQAVLTKLEGTGEGTDEDSNQLVFIYLCCQ